MNRCLMLVLLFSAVLTGYSSDDSVRLLSDRNDVIRTINMLFIESDHRNWPAVKVVFADTVLFDMTSMTGGKLSRLTSTQIIKAWEERLKPSQAVHHQAGNYLVTLRESEADAFYYGIASHYLPNASGRNTRTYVGTYDFHFMKRGSNWVIDRFRFNVKYIDGNQDFTGPVQ